MPALTTLTQSIRLAHPLSAIHHSNLAQNFDTLKIRVHRFIPSALLGTVCAITLGFYAWTARPGVPQSAMGLWISSGATATNDPADAYYNLLVQGFRNGQLNLKKEISPGLTKLADPYDPVANISYRENGLHDISYYKNKLYLYFGVTPAVVLFWPYAVLTGHYLYHKQAVAIFCSTGFLVSVALLCAFRRRYFPEVGGVVVAACALALGLATCVPVMLQRPEVYEVPISCAYAMVMLALAGIWRALHDPARRCWWLAAASLAYGLALGARPSLLFGAVILLAPIAHAWFALPGRNERRWLVAGRKLAAAVVPILLVGFGLLLYNYLRFQNPLEFGQRYQMAGNTEDQMRRLFGLKYLWFNFQVYFLQPIQWGYSFPFVEGVEAPPMPAGELGRDVPFGVLVNLPLVCMALAVPLVWQKRTADERSALRFFSAVLAAFVVFSALTICFFIGACMRYEVDFVPELVLLAVCGILGLERALVEKPPWRGVLRGAWIAALVFSLGVNLLMSIRLHVAELVFGGYYQLSHGRPKETVICFEQALRIKPDCAEVHNDLAYALAQIPGRLPEAIVEFEAALRIWPDDMAARDNLRAAFVRLDRLPDAIAQYETVLRLDPDSAETHFNFGQALLKIPGRLPDAMAQFNAALRLKPDLESARKMLDRLQNPNGLNGAGPMDSSLRH
jgi:hypothetical protein